MKKIRKTQYLLLFLYPVIAFSQTRPGDNTELEDYAYLDYWPILLLPIFGFVFYKLWWRKKQSKEQGKTKE